jgi:hypothetical protein
LRLLTRAPRTMMLSRSVINYSEVEQTYGLWELSGPIAGVPPSAPLRLCAFARNGLFIQEAVLAKAQRLSHLFLNDHKADLKLSAFYMLGKTIGAYRITGECESFVDNIRFGVYKPALDVLNAS